MNKRRIREYLKNRKVAGSVAAIALAAIVGGTVFFQNMQSVPEFPEIYDPIIETIIDEETTPLASAPQVSTKTTKKTTKKNVKLAKVATKTYTKKLATTKKTSTSKSSNATQSITTQTTVVTASSEKYTKKSKTKAVTTTVTTTVKTTKVAKATPTPVPKAYTLKEVTIDSVAPAMDSRVRGAFQTLGFTIVLDPNVSYSGYFNAKNQMITLNAKQQDLYPDTVYHELGHFLAFITGGLDTKADFVAVYNEEKTKLPGVGKAYAGQSSSEFFAECVKLYTTSPASLKSSCPKAYAAIQNALNKVTDSNIAMIKKVYAPYWK